MNPSEVFAGADDRHVGDLAGQGADDRNRTPGDLNLRFPFLFSRGWGDLGFGTHH